MDEKFAYSWDNPEYRRTYHHTCSHILAQAVKRLYPEAKLTIGPAIDNGFYYDIDFAEPITADDLAKIEDEMKKILTSVIFLSGRCIASTVCFITDVTSSCGIELCTLPVLFCSLKPTFGVTSKPENKSRTPLCASFDFSAFWEVADVCDK